MASSESHSATKLKDMADMDLPPVLRGVRPIAHDIIENAIKDGGELTRGQIEFVLECVRFCITNNDVVLPRSYAACAYLCLSERSELDNNSRRIMEILGKSQKIMDAAKQILEAREAKKAQSEKREAEAADEVSKQAGEKENERSFIPTAYDHLSAMSAALGAINYESAVSHAMSAVRYFPEDEKILLLAGMCCMGRALKHAGADYYPESRRSDLEHAIDFFRRCKEHSVGQEGAKAEEALHIAFKKLKKVEEVIFKEDKKREKKTI